MRDKLEKIIKAYEELEKKLSDPAVASDIKEFTRLNKEYAHQSDLIAASREYIGALDDIEAASKNGTLQEAWATGTACVISPIGYLRYKGRDIVINGGNVGPVSQKLYDTIYGMQTGVKSDDMGWIVQI